MKINILINYKSLFETKHNSVPYESGMDKQLIKDTFEATEYLLDPHTAIGVEAARKTRRSNDVPMVCLATAHPAKFPEAIQKAGCQDPSLPHHMQDLFDREERYQVLDNDITKVHSFMGDHIRT